MAVTRCVCHRRSFAELRTAAEHADLTTVAALSAATRCGTGCGSCLPYLDAMLATGATCFAVRSGDAPPVPCAPDPWDC